MAAHATVSYAGLEFTAEPKYWLRRATHFPFFFENCNPSFSIFIHRVSEPPDGEQWPDGKITFEVLFADNTKAALHEDVPDLRVGQAELFDLLDVYTACPGRTTIRLVVGPQAWKILYAYDVRREESIWLGVWAAFLAVASFIAAVAGIISIAR